MLENGNEFRVHGAVFTVLRRSQLNGNENRDLQRLAADICDVYDDSRFAYFLRRHAPPLEANIDLRDVPHSLPLTVGAEYRSTVELKAILLHEGWAHSAIADSGRDAVLIEVFKRMFPQLRANGLPEEVTYRHVGVNALEVVGMSRVVSPAVHAAYFKPQTRKDRNPLRTPVYEAIYNLVTDPVVQNGTTNLQKIIRVLKQNGVRVP